MNGNLTVIGIENEFEGDSTLYFNLSEPEKFADYVKHNLEYGDKYVFTISVMSQDEFKELD